MMVVSCNCRPLDEAIFDTILRPPSWVETEVANISRAHISNVCVANPLIFDTNPSFHCAARGRLFFFFLNSRSRKTFFPPLSVHITKTFRSPSFGGILWMDSPLAPRSSIHHAGLQSQYYVYANTLMFAVT